VVAGKLYGAYNAVIVPAYTLPAKPDAMTAEASREPDPPLPSLRSHDASDEAAHVLALIANIISPPFRLAWIGLSIRIHDGRMDDTLFYDAGESPSHAAGYTNLAGFPAQWPPAYPSGRHYAGLRTQHHHPEVSLAGASPRCYLIAGVRPHGHWRVPLRRLPRPVVLADFADARSLMPALLCLMLLHHNVGERRMPAGSVRHSALFGVALLAAAKASCCCWRRSLCGDSLSLLATLRQRSRFSSQRRLVVFPTDATPSAAC
jgi:hypothetical protein